MKSGSGNLVKHGDIGKSKWLGGWMNVVIKGGSTNQTRHHRLKPSFQFEGTWKQKTRRLLETCIFFKLPFSWVQSMRVCVQWSEEKREEIQEKKNRTEHVRTVKVGAIGSPKGLQTTKKTCGEKCILRTNSCQCAPNRLCGGGGNVDRTSWKRFLRSSRVHENVLLRWYLSLRGEWRAFDLI